MSSSRPSSSAVGSRSSSWCDPAPGAHHLVDLLGQVDGQPDGAAGVGHGAGDRLPDPPGGVGRELEALGVVELLDRADQADVALLDQVQERHAVAGVALGHRHHQPQVGLQQVRLGGLAVDGQRLVVPLLGGGEALLLGEQALGVEAGLDPLGQLDLLLGGQQRGLADGVEVHAHEVGRHQAAWCRARDGARAHPEGVVGGRLQQRHDVSSSLPSVRMPPPVVVGGGGPSGRQVPGAPAFAGRPLALLSDVVRRAQRSGPGSCSTDARFTANRRECLRHGPLPAVGAPCNVQPAAKSIAAQTSSSRVIGPSLTERDLHPRAEHPGRDRCSRAGAVRPPPSSTSGSATSPGAASCQEGRRPLRVSA